MFNVQQTCKDLEAAIAHMRNTGWIQGRNFDRAGNCCAWGAVIYVTSQVRGQDLDRQLDRTADVGRAFYRVHHTDIVSFNDSEGRTKDQVVLHMQKALDALKADPSILTAVKERTRA